MSILDEIQTTGMIVPRITIYGVQGIGKSTLAAQFPSPLFLLTERTIEGVKALPVCQSLQEFWGNLKKLYQDEGFFEKYKTLVIDSVSKLDELIVRYILAEEDANIKAEAAGQKHKITTLAAACGGYGKGYERAQNLHRAIKLYTDKFTDRGIAVIFLAHQTTMKYRAPDSEDYDIYSITMNGDKSREPYIHDVDAVLFGRIKSFTETLDSGKSIVKSTQDRVLVTGVNNANISKNRFSMPNEIPMEFNELKKHIPFYNQHKESE